METGPLSLWIIGLVWAALVVLAIYYYRRTVPEVSLRVRRILLGLRLFALTLIAVALAQPIFDWQNPRTVKPEWRLLVDYSASMDKVEGSEPSRLSQALAIAQDDSWSQAAPDVIIERGYFAGDEATDSAGLDREATDVHAALTRLSEQAEIPAAVVLLSDGATNGPRDPAASTWPFPVYSICMGDSIPGQDLAATELVGPATAVAGDSVTMMLEATSEGGSSKSAVSFQVGDHKQNTMEQFDGGGRRQEFKFSFRPDTAGLYRVRAEVAAGRDELSSANNRVEAHVYVEPRKRNCLVLAVTPDWETSFLVRTLKGNDRLESDVRYRRLQGRSGRAWPQTLDSLLNYDVVVITDMQASEWGPLTDGLSRFVHEGGGALFLLGPEAAKTAWQPNQEALLGMQAPVNPPGTLALDQPLRLAPAGAYHPVTMHSENQTALGDLSRMTGLIPVQLRAGVQRLLESSGPVSWPALAAATVGQGRVLVANCFPLWRAGFAPGAPATSDAQSEFWHRAVTWLSTSTQASRLAVETPGSSVPLFTAPEFSAVMVDETWKPDVGATVTAIVRGADSSVVQTFELVGAGGGHYRGAGRPMQAGDYTYEVIARHDTLVVANQTGPLTVSSLSRESLSPASRPADLDRLAAATGGRRLSLAKWKDELGDLPRKERVQIQYGTFRLWDHPLLLTLLIATLAAEWILRRRHQML